MKKIYILSSLILSSLSYTAPLQATQNKVTTFSTATIGLILSTLHSIHQDKKNKKTPRLYFEKGWSIETLEKVPYDKRKNYITLFHTPPHAPLIYIGNAGLRGGGNGSSRRKDSFDNDDLPDYSPPNTPKLTFPTSGQMPSLDDDFLSNDCISRDEIPIPKELNFWTDHESSADKSPSPCIDNTSYEDNYTSTTTFPLSSLHIPTQDKIPVPDFSSFTSKKCSNDDHINTNTSKPSYLNIPTQDQLSLPDFSKRSETNLFGLKTTEEIVKKTTLNLTKNRNTLTHSLTPHKTTSTKKKSTLSFKNNNYFKESYTNNVYFYPQNNTNESDSLLLQHLKNLEKKERKKNYLLKPPTLKDKPEELVKTNQQFRKKITSNNKEKHKYEGIERLKILEQKRDLLKHQKIQLDYLDIEDTPRPNSELSKWSREIEKKIDDLYKEITLLRDLYKPGNTPEPHTPTLSEWKEVGKEVGKGIVHEFKGIVDSVIHPITTIQSMGKVILDPEQFWQDYQKYSQQAWEAEYDLSPKKRAEKRNKEGMHMGGRGIGLVLSFFIIDKGLSKLSNLGKAKVIAELSEEINIVSKLTSVSEIAFETTSLTLKNTNSIRKILQVSGIDIKVIEEFIEVIQFTDKIKKTQRLESLFARESQLATTLEEVVNLNKGGILKEVAPNLNKTTKTTEVVSSTEKSAYEIAKSGGKHHGDYTNYLNRSRREIEKSIRSYQKAITEHENLINAPSKYLKIYGKEKNGIPWDRLALKDKLSLINKKWPSDIKRLKELKNIMEGILKNKP